VRRALVLAALALAFCGRPALPISADEVDEWASQHVAFKPGCNGGHCMTAEIMSSQRRQMEEGEAPCGASQ
jgi:hypothetical protein